jgi:hypothetical protein
MNAHTPGPWLIETDRESGGFVILGDDYEVAVVTPPDDDSEAIGSAEADAVLIAAAPELLDACKRLLTFNEELAVDVGVSTHYPSAELARAAIAKAEGRA